jgi:hypothetical protein
MWRFLEDEASVQRPAAVQQSSSPAGMGGERENLKILNFTCEK